MTKVTTLDELIGGKKEQKKEKRNKKPIKFRYWVTSHTKDVGDVGALPSDFMHIIVMPKMEEINEVDYDVFYCYNDWQELGCIVWGHLNDGFVEQ